MNDYLVFNCQFTVNQITCAIYNDVAVIDFPVIDYDNYKAFFLLLRNTIEQLKTNNIKYIQQNILKNDWLYTFANKRTSWKIIEDNKLTNMYKIECPICDSLENIGIGFDIKNIVT